MNGMEKMCIGGLQCQLFATTEPEILLIQPSARHEQKNNGLMTEADNIASSYNRGFVLATFDCEDWARALMPWHDAAVSRLEDVGMHAHDTLQYVEHCLLPWLKERYGMLPCVIGGYSLGGLFALWSARQTGIFSAVAAASPSLWINEWGEYSRTHPILTNQVYLSLGDREEHCRNQRMKRIGDCVRQEYATLAAQLGKSNVCLEWNSGGHFGDEARRMAQSFAWCCERL